MTGSPASVTETGRLANRDGCDCFRYFFATRGHGETIISCAHCGGIRAALLHTGHQFWVQFAKESRAEDDDEDLFCEMYGNDYAAALAAFHEAELVLLRGEA